MSKEQIYDDQIRPLMAQIIAISKEHDINIAFMACMERNSDDDAEDDSPLYVTTYIPAKRKNFAMWLMYCDGRNEQGAQGRSRFGSTENFRGS